MHACTSGSHRGPSQQEGILEGSARFPSALRCATMRLVPFSRHRHVAIDPRPSSRKGREVPFSLRPRPTRFPTHRDSIPRVRSHRCRTHNGSSSRRGRGEAGASRRDRTNARRSGARAHDRFSSASERNALRSRNPIESQGGKETIGPSFERERFSRRGGIRSFRSHARGLAQGGLVLRVDARGCLRLRDVVLDRSSLDGVVESFERLEARDGNRVAIRSRRVQVGTHPGVADGEGCVEGHVARSRVRRRARRVPMHRRQLLGAIHPVVSEEEERDVRCEDLAFVTCNVRSTRAKTKSRMNRGRRRRRSLRTPSNRKEQPRA